MMKKAVMGTTLAVFALAPALAWSDCDYHNQAAMAQMASAKPADNAPAKANVARSTPTTAKAAASDAAKRTADKAARSTPKPEATAMVAKSN